MSEMVERVARKMCWHAHMMQVDVVVHGPSIWREGELEAKVDAYWPKWIEAARDTIDSMREPTGGAAVNTNFGKAFIYIIAVVFMAFVCWSVVSIDRPGMSQIKALNARFNEH